MTFYRNSFWPNGVKAENKPPRDMEMKNRTRVAAKIALLSCLSDELKHIIGSETTRRGLLRVFELFQRPVLNRRLLYVLLEGIVETLFPQNNLVTIFRKLYSVSPRVRSRSKTKSWWKNRTEWCPNAMVWEWLWGRKKFTEIEELRLHYQSSIKCISSLWIT